MLSCRFAHDESELVNRVEAMHHMNVDHPHYMQEPPMPGLPPPPPPPHLPLSSPPPLPNFPLPPRPEDVPYPPPPPPPPEARWEPPKGPLGPAPFSDLDPDKVQKSRKVLTDFMASVTEPGGKGALALPENWGEMEQGLEAMDTSPDEEVESHAWNYPHNLDPDLCPKAPAPANLCVGLQGSLDVRYTRYRGAS